MHRPGFTLIEFLVTVAVFGVGLTLVSLNLLSTQHKGDIFSAVQVLVSDLKQQQLKAMKGWSGQAQGVYFDNAGYVLFTGSTYNAMDLGNVRVDMPTGVELNNIALPGQVVVFVVGSGEVAGWVDGFNGLQIEDSSQGEVKSLEINQYGVVEYGS